ncbi:MAG: aminotransferase class [Gammaproteobacteria bacterium]|jgi:aspartate aminotransferase|nr:aminotransferase class [Gammaproteobacteria bacterium]
MTIATATRLKKLQPSPTMAMNAKARALEAKGIEILSLSVGEPDFDTPEYICNAAIDAIHSGFTRYTAADGIAPLKAAIQDKFKRDNQLNYNANEIIVTSGAKQALANALCAILNPGDEVLIPAPYWVSYPDMVILGEGTPKYIYADHTQDFKITAEQLEAAITPRTRVFAINSPNNPTGMIYSAKELKALAEVLKKHPNIIILSDDIYEHLIWSDHSFANLVMVCPELKDRTIVVNGVSKSYAMTGWRIGYAAGPAEVINQMKNIQMQTTSAPNSIAQMAALTAINGPQDSIPLMNKEFKKRHDFLVQALSALPGVKCVPAQGAFYLLPDFSAWLKQHPEIGNDEQLAETLLTEIQVATVAGTPFGAPDCIRLSFASSIDTLEEAMRRLERFVKQ